MAAAAAVTITQAAGTMGYLVAKELGSQAFGFTLARLSDILGRLSQYDCEMGRTAHAQLARLIPTAKLNITRALMADFDGLRPTSQTVDALLQAIDQAASAIACESQAVEIKIERHRKETWFAAWRTLDLSAHVERVRAAVETLDANFSLLTQLLPSCVVAIAASNHHKHINNTSKDPQTATLALLAPQPPTSSS